jgi:hypothetical protein
VTRKNVHGRGAPVGRRIASTGVGAGPSPDGSRSVRSALCPHMMGKRNVSTLLPQAERGSRAERLGAAKRDGQRAGAACDPPHRRVTALDPTKITVALTKAFLAVEGSSAAASRRVRVAADSAWTLFSPDETADLPELFGPAFKGPTMRTRRRRRGASFASTAPCAPSISGGGCWRCCSRRGTLESPSRTPATSTRRKGTPASSTRRNSARRPPSTPPTARWRCAISAQ